MDPEEYEAYWRRHQRVSHVTWYGLLGLSVALGLVIGLVWTFAVGIPVTVVSAALAFSLQLKFSKARWIHRFPELAREDVSWRRTSGQSRRRR